FVDTTRPVNVGCHLRSIIAMPLTDISSLVPSSINLVTETIIMLI
ncbi:MAG: hypothetical protein ACJAZF_004315, partial [Granulosicoccus sp.]